MRLTMFTRHVAHLSSAYLHNELSADQTGKFADHIISCSVCRQEFEDVKRGATFGEQLELLSAPDHLWPRIAANLNQRPSRLSRFQSWKPLMIAATIVLLIGAGLLWLRRPPKASHLLQQPPETSQSGWEVARLGGAPRIDAEKINDKGRLGVGQWLETDSVSRAKLDVADIGNIEIDPNTRVRLLQSGANEHRLELAQGRLSAVISAPPKVFFVNTPSGVAEDLGCAYTLEVDEAGNSHLRVTLGWVSLQLTDRVSVVPAGAECVTRPGIGPGTPYFEDASEAFRSSLSQFDFPSDQSSPSSTLETIIREARPRDAMTLFYLLPRVNGSDRARVYDRMVALVPAPAGVTREGSLSLDPQMLEHWREILGLTWGLPEDKAVKTWKKVWTRGLGKVNGLQGKR
jgi:hypothetical protein